MKKNLLLLLLSVWIVGGLLLTFQIIDYTQGMVEILFEGFLCIAIYVLGSILLCGIIYAFACLLKKEGRRGLSEYFTESVAKREIKRCSKRSRRQNGFWKYFCRGLGFGVGWSIFNQHDRDGGF